MGEHGDIIKTLRREMTQQGVSRGAADLTVYDPAATEARRLTGRVVARGLSDELNDWHYLIVDGVDGRAHHVDIGRAMQSIRSRKGLSSRSNPSTPSRVPSIVPSPRSRPRMATSRALPGSTASWLPTRQ
jgi:Protein of unknown function (DUF3363)